MQLVKRIRCCWLKLCIYFREACSIELEDKVVVTGGFPGRTNVQVYDLSGPVETLPDMKTPRYSHACGYMVNSDDQLVSIYRVDQKKGDLKKHGHNYFEIHQKGKKLVCFGKFSSNAAG